MRRAAPVVLTLCVSAALAQPSAPRGLDALSDDALLTELATRRQTALLERAFEQQKVPDAKRQALRTLVALDELRERAPTLGYEERGALVRQATAGLDAALAAVDDPAALLRQAEALVAGGVQFDANLVEYWGDNARTQSRLRPTVGAARRVVHRAAERAERQRVEAEEQITNAFDGAAQERYAAAETLKAEADNTLLLVDYYDALAADPADPRRGELARSVAERLAAFDDDANPQRNFVRRLVGKTELLSDPAAAAATFGKIVDGPLADDSPDIAFEARYFTVVAALRAGDPAAARQQLDVFEKWADANAPADAAGKAAADAARQMLRARVLNLEAERAAPADATAARERATKALTDLIESRPDLRPVLLENLLAGVGDDKPVADLSDLALSALVDEGRVDVLKPEGERDAKRVGRALEAARALLARPNADARGRREAAFLLGPLLEAQGDARGAAAAYLDYADQFRDRDRERGLAALEQGKRLVGTLLAAEGGADDAQIGELFGRVFPIATKPPYDQRELNYDYGRRLLALDDPDEAANALENVPADDPNRAATRYYLLLALDARFRKLAADAPTRGPLLQRIGTLADEVGQQAGDDPAARSRRARTRVLAADLARTAQDDPRRALAVLDGFEGAAAGLPDEEGLVGEALFTRIQAQYALGETKAATDGLIALLQRTGGQRGQQIVYNLLQKLDADFAAAEGDRPRQAELARARGELTPFLVRWAESNANPDVKRYAYTYKVYDAESQRQAAEFSDDPAQRAAKLDEAAKRFEELDAEAGLAQYRELLPPEQRATAFYDVQVALGRARIAFAREDWPQARDRFGRLLADRTLGLPTLVTREPTGGVTSRPNDAYWEATLRWLQGSERAGDDPARLKAYLAQQFVQYDRPGGTRWGGELDQLRAAWGVQVSQAAPAAQSPTPGPVIRPRM